MENEKEGEYHESRQDGKNANKSNSTTNKTDMIKTNTLITNASPMIQFLLAIIECIAPAFEIYGSSLDDEEYNGSGEEYNNHHGTTPTPQQRYKYHHERLVRVWNALHKLECIKFTSRLSIVLSYVWCLHQRLILDDDDNEDNENAEGEEENNARGREDNKSKLDLTTTKARRRRKRRYITSNKPLCAGILQEGGALRLGSNEYNDHGIKTLQQQEDDIETLCYIGKRTGRRLVSNNVALGDDNRERKKC
eukprot:13492274-Ditylum_brightwellii.AAC.1